MIFLKKRIVVKHFLFFVIAYSFTSIVTAQDEVQSKKERKAKSSFKVYAGVNLNDLNIDTSTDLQSDAAMAYNLGFSY